MGSLSKSDSLVFGALILIKPTRLAARFAPGPANVRFGSLADIFALRKPCPLYPRKRTCAAQLGDVR